ncbi:MAG: RNA polymerase sigma factor [Kofleriaceae bacterium]
MTPTQLPPRNESVVWDDAIRRFDRQVYLSVLALGLNPDRAREISQAAWTKLIERHASGGLPDLELPGLAIRQARFLGLNELQRSKVEKRVLSAVPDEPSSPMSAGSIDVERQIDSRAQVEKVLAALASCSPTARRVFRLVYATPGGSPAHAAREVGLSLQRVRQILCETRAHIRKTLSTEEVVP